MDENVNREEAKPDHITVGHGPDKSGGKVRCPEVSAQQAAAGMIAIEVLVLVLITAIPPLLGNSFGTNPDVFINVYANFTGLLAIIGATLFAGDAIVSEFQGRTGYLLFPNPVKRSVLLAGKFIASVGAMFIVLFVYYGSALVLDLVLTGRVLDCRVSNRCSWQCWLR